MSITDALDLPAACFTSTPQNWWSALAPEDWTPDARWGLSDRVLEPLEILHAPAGPWPGPAIRPPPSRWRSPTIVMAPIPRGSTR